MITASIISICSTSSDSFFDLFKYETLKYFMKSTSFLHLIYDLIKETISCNLQRYILSALTYNGFRKIHYTDRHIV